MKVNAELNNYFDATSSVNELKRDQAVEYLGDILESEVHNANILQKIVNHLGTLLIKEESDTVIESILNALSNSVYSQSKLEMPIEVIKAIYPRLKGDSVEHANYILTNTYKAKQ